MKRHLLLTITMPLIMIMSQPSAIAGLIVTDPTLIAINKAHQARDLAEQLLRRSNQVQQIKHFIQQIAQLDDYLQRYGHPGIKIADPELAKLIELLKAKVLSKTSEELFQDIAGSEIFNEQSQQRPDSVRPEFVLDGKTVERDPELYREDAEAKRTFDHYDAVRRQVLERRQTLRQSLGTTIQQLQAAQTESEIRKLSALISGLQTELAAIDQEMGFAASAVVTRQLQTEAAQRLRAKAHREESIARHREAARRDAEFYQLLTAPIYFNARGNR